MPSDLNLAPAKPAPKPTTMHQRFPWLPATGNADTHMAPIREEVKATSAVALALRKLAADNPREFSRQLTANLTARGCPVPK